MNKRTTIQIESTTLERMKKFRIAKRDTYDEIIVRWMDENEKNV